MNKDTKGNHIESSEDSLYKVKSLALGLTGSSPSLGTIYNQG